MAEPVPEAEPKQDPYRGARLLLLITTCGVLVVLVGLGTFWLFRTYG